MITLPLVDRLRLDKWLWAARLYKTRSLAASEAGLGRVKVNGYTVKPSRELKAGDQIEIRRDGQWREYTVLALSTVRGPAPLAQALLAETPASQARHEQAAQERRLAAEPALTIAQGRPTKRDRRSLEQSKTEWRRWSASVDD